MHIPVLLNEVIKILNPRKGETYIDATVGEGGHSIEILKRIAPKGTLLGIDWDNLTAKKTTENLAKYADKNKVIVVEGNYADLKEFVEKYRLEKVDGILFDLGFGTHTIAESGRGFSFLKDEVLDMRYDSTSNNLTAGEIVNTRSQKEIERIITEYGEDRCARRIAERIVETRRRNKIKTTRELVNIIEQVLPKRGKIHPATKTFQALRIAVNHELDNLRKGLSDALEIVGREGKIAVISFHSLEDRIVKNFFRNEAQKGNLKILTKKPIIAKYQEIKNNPRSRSAKLRAARKV